MGVKIMWATWLFSMWCVVRAFQKTSWVAGGRPLYKHFFVSKTWPLRASSKPASSAGSTNPSKEGKYKARRGVGKGLIADIEGILKKSRSRGDTNVGRELFNFLDDSDALLNRVHAVSMVRMAAKYHFDLTSAVSLKTVQRLYDFEHFRDTSHINIGDSLTTLPVWEAYMLSQVVYGLRMFNSKTEGIDAYLDYIAGLLEEAETSGKKMNNQEVANSLYGLAGLGASAKVDRILSALLKLAPESIVTASNTFGGEDASIDDSMMKGILASPMDGQEVSMALYGLRTISSTYYQMNARSRALPQTLEFLARKIAESPGTLSPRGCANALNGLKGLNPSKMRECRCVVEALAPRVVATIQSGQRFDPVAVGSALSGLKAMDAKTPAVLALIDAFAGVIERSSKGSGECEMYQQATIASCVIGLSSMKDDERAVRRVVAALAVKINEHPQCVGGDVTSIGDVSGEGLAEGNSTEADDEEEEDEDDEEEDHRSGIEVMVQPPELADGMSWRVKSDNNFASGDEQGNHNNDDDGDAGDVEGGRALFTAQTIATMLQSIRQMTGRHWQTRSLLEAIQRKVTLNAVQPFTSQDIGRCMYGLQSMSANRASKGRHNRALRTLLGKLASKIDTLANRELHPRDVGSSLYGLKSCRINSNQPSNNNNAAIADRKEREVRQVLKALAVRIASQPDKALSAQSFGMAMLGMKSMSSDAREVQMVLRALTSRLRASGLDKQACANALYSMAQMSSEDRDVRQFLAALTPKFAACMVLRERERESDGNGSSKLFSAQEVSNAFYGMQKMDSKHVETIAMLTVLVRALKALVAATTVTSATGGDPLPKMTSQGVGNSLFGLQTMENEDNHIVDECLGCFTELIDQLKEPLSPRDAASALFGFQGINVLTDEVKGVLLALTEKMAVSEEQWSPKDIGYALVGMSGLQQTAGGSPEVAGVISLINIKLGQSELRGESGVTFKLFGGRGFKILDAYGNVITKG